MRLVLPLAACLLGGCNAILGLDEPSAARDGDPGAIDAPPSDAIDGATDAIDGGRSQITAVTAGGAHTCAVRDGRVRCWGRAASGQTGHGDQVDIGDDELPAIAADVALSGAVIDVVAGFAHTCVRFEAGAIACWGEGDDGRLGYANTTDVGDDETPAGAGTFTLGGAAATAIAAGGAHTCAVADNFVYCWGRAGGGRLGYGDEDDVGDNETPTSAGEVPGVGPVYAVAAGESHTCVLRIDGSVACWGSGGEGRLGYGNQANLGDNPAEVGSAVSTSGPVIAIAAGAAHTCVVLASRDVQCWGFNALGQLGYGNTTNIGDDEVPTSAGLVNLGGAAMAIAAGANHTCALLTSGAVRCWGVGGRGQLGYDSTHNIGDDEPPAIAGDVPLGEPAVAITAGGDHTCALLDSGAVRCWGDGASGQLGLGNEDNVGDDERPSDVPYVVP